MRRILCASAALLLTGCALSKAPYRPVAYYDIETSGAPADPGGAKPLDRALQIGRFVMLGPYKTRMMYRKDAQRLARDEYHRWIQPPEELVARELFRAMSASGRFTEVVATAHANADLRLSGVVLRLECSADLQAHLQMTLRLEDVSRGKLLLSRQYEEKQALAEEAPEAFAQAAAAALGRIAAAALEDVAAAAGEAASGP